MGPEQFSVLFVCTANICRSPIAAELTRLRIRAARRPDARHVVVGSAGTHGHDGAAMDPRALAVLRSLGAQPTGFTARTLTVSLTAETDLVLTAQRRHRAAVVALHPRSHAKAFTILEFARLVGHVDPGRLSEHGVVHRARSLVQEATRLRGISPPAGGDEDVTDPFGRSTKEFRACASVIEAALDHPLRLILA